MTARSSGSRLEPPGEVVEVVGGLVVDVVAAVVDVDVTVVTVGSVVVWAGIVAVPVVSIAGSDAHPASTLTMKRLMRSLTID